MIGRALQAFADEAVYSRIGTGRRHDLVEQVGADAARAGIGEQFATRRQQLEGQAVDVLVGACGALGVRGGGRKLGRVEHDGIKGFAALDELAQAGVHIGIHEGGAGFVKAIEPHMGTGTLECGAG